MTEEYKALLKAKGIRCLKLPVISRNDEEEEEKELRIIPKVIGRIPGRPEVNVDLEFKGPKSVIDGLDFTSEDYPWPYVEYTDSEENYNLFDVGSDVDPEYDFYDEGWLFFEPDEGLDSNNVLHATVFDETGETTFYMALFLLDEDGEGGEKSTCIAKAVPFVTPDVPEDFIFAISGAIAPVKDDDTKTSYGVQLSRSLGLTETLAYGLVDYSVGDTASLVTKATTETEDHGGIIYNMTTVPVNYSSFLDYYYAYILDANDKVLTICKVAGSPMM